MAGYELADRILGLLSTAERTTRRTAVPAAELCTQLDAAMDEVRAALCALDDLGFVRYLRGFRTGDVVVLRPAGRQHLMDLTLGARRRRAYITSGKG